MKSILNDRYEIIEEIGSGGMAYVYKARCNVLNRFVAIKVLKEEFTKDQEFIDKFKQESMSAAGLNHKNIVNIYDTGVDGDIYFIVMELVSGITLNEMIENEKPIPIGKVLDISLQICEALDHAHTNGVIHRDIKPHNILVNKYNLVKVADFGIARAVTNKTITNNDNTLGSVNYLSPEQARGGYIDQRSDIYSFGIVMYELLTGEVPFKGDTPISIALKHVNERVLAPSQVNKEVSSRVDSIVLKCTNNKSTLRYSSISEVIEDIKKIYGKSSLYAMRTESLGSDERNDAFNKFFDENETTDDKNFKVEKKKFKLKKKIKKKIKTKKDEDNDEEKIVVKGKFKYTILAIITALIVTGTLSILALNFIKDYLTVNVVEVPGLIGYTEELARERVEDLGLEFSVKDRIYNSEHKEGLVINQNINEGQELKEGFPIEVVVSKGEKLVKTPDLKHKYSNESIVILKEKDLVEGDVTYEFNETIPWGLVIEQIPEAGTMIKEGSEVSYILSKGPEVEYTLMPDVLHKHIDDVQNIILERGFKVGEITYKPSDTVEEDLVIYQSYPSGTEVEKGTSINLIVSSGAEIQIEIPVDIEDISDTEVSGNGELLVELPQEKDKVHLLIERVLEDKRIIVYDKQVKTENSPLSIGIEGFGIQKFEIFINSEYYGVEEINFGE